METRGYLEIVQDVWSEAEAGLVPLPGFVRQHGAICWRNNEETTPVSASRETFSESPMKDFRDFSRKMPKFINIRSSHS